MVNPKLNRQRGKSYERYIANRLGGRRMGVMGKEDVDHPLFSIECKSFARFAGEKVMAQAERNAYKDKTPLSIVHIRGNSHDKDIVMMRLSDFEDYLGKLKTVITIEEV